MTTKKMTHKIKNILLVLMPVISQLKTFFYGQKHRVDWFIFYEETKRIDFAVFYYTLSINFLIISYCLYRPKGVSNDVKFFIFIVCVMDMIHLLTLAGRGYGVAKIGLSVIVLLVYKLLNKNRWQRLKTY